MECNYYGASLACIHLSTTNDLAHIAQRTLDPAAGSRSACATQPSSSEPSSLLHPDQTRHRASKMHPIHEDRC